VPNNQAQFGSYTPNAKRKASGGAPVLDNSAKRARQDNNWQDHTPKKAKSVSFTADTTGPRAKIKQPKQASIKGAVEPTPAKPIKRTAPVNLEPALAYLRAWHSARESWKFNKNHQTKLLEQVFADADETTIPAADISIFYEYIRGLQGGVRTRLRELANGIKAQDMEKSFTASANNKTEMEMVERKQKEYEEVIKAFMAQTPTPEKRRFNEVDYVLRTTDMEMQRRVVKRMRAEMVLDELSETEESETTATTTSTKSTSTEKARTTGTADDDKRLKLNDGAQQRVKRKRKTRTAVVEDDTSSESDSESDADSDTSSSGSSSDSSSEESDDDEEAPGPERNEETSSSSSSSSSGSDSESDSEDDNDED
jgi:hypothetical protein